jgi:adenosylcobyric acid synthase
MPPAHAKAIMIQGTGSHVGKSLLVTALCRMLADEGIRVAPFKAQNMALNSCVTPDGGEIGRAQALQALAARLEPWVEMNPILLKPTSDTGSQVIVNGHVVGSMGVKEYHQYKPVAWRAVVEAYERLASEFDVLVIEGAGSPAEINLKAVDIVNMRVAMLADAQVLLVGDIDRGGVFASLLGTMEWLEESERERVAGFLINKFRGEASLLGPGIEALRDRTGRGVWGVIPFIPDLRLEEEDGVALEAASALNSGEEGQVVIGVVRFPRISNFTDVDPWRDEPSVAVRFVSRPEELEGVRVVLLPGTKNTIEDLQWFRRSGLAERVHAIARGGGHVVGICGGFQMLGRAIADPHHVETSSEPVEGLGLLPVSTTLEAAKVLAQVQLEPDGDWVCSYHGSLGERRHALACRGYEIHMGRSERIGLGRPAFRILTRNRQAVQEEDGGISEDRRVWGSYAHGLFENDQFRRCLIARWGGPSCLEGTTPSVSFVARRERELTRLAAIVKGHVDYRQIKKCLGF